MKDLIRPVLEFTVILPGILLAFLPVKPYLKQAPLRLAAWLLPLLLAVCIFSGALCFVLQLPTAPLLFLLLPFVMLLYHKALHIQFWKSGSIFLAVCAVFACVNSLSRAANAFFTASLHLTENELWFRPAAGLLYNLICLLFVLLAWYPATHAARNMIQDENFAQTWYTFWILPLIFITLNCFMVPKYRGTLYTGRILQGYVVLSLILLAILILFYTMFLLMANSLNRNARLQQENHFLSMQQARYDNLRIAIDETRQARHDLRHHFLQLSALAEHGELEKIKEYLSGAVSKIPDLDLHFCENKAADSVIGYYCALARRDSIPFQARANIPASLSTDEIDLCLILSNLLENALEASLKTAPDRRRIDLTIYPHFTHLLLIQVKNTFEGEIQEKGGIFQSSKRSSDGIGIQSVRRICEKNGGASNFSCENGVFIAQIMLRMDSE